jgi:DNA-binding NtrC family response regulator
MRKVRDQVQLLAGIDAPVLILGETGTGRQTTAKLIHHLSARTDAHFSKVNAAAFAGELLESELFGNERGTTRKAGKLELCNGGTLLLDQVDEMSPTAQVKLLQFLRDRQIIPLGSDTSVEAEVRVLAATDFGIHHSVSERRFREDLYYALSGFTVTLPPLRERDEDIPLLLHLFVEELAAKFQRDVVPLSSRLIDSCVRYTWPGNLHELENFVKRLVVMGDEETALRELAQRSATHLFVAEETRADSDIPSLRSVVKTARGEAERNAILTALEATGWNRKAAARLLQISYRKLLYRIEEYRLSPPEEDSPKE